MKITKLLAVALTATLMCGTVNVNAYAAEQNTAEIVTEVESTQQSTNEDTAIENISIEESSKKESKSEEKKEVVKESTTKKDKKEAKVEDTTTVAKETKKSTETKTTTTKKTETTKKTTKTTSNKKTTTKIAKAATVTPKSIKASYTKEQLRLLSSLIFCEAGSESYAGKLAVGIVVMNRVESKSFPNTLNNVVYQKYQFGPARNGSLKKALANYDAGRFTTKNHKECIEAAKAALSGAKSVTYRGKTINMKSTLYFSGRVSGAKFSIGNHQFK